MELGLAGRVALVTGGSKGIGRACAAGLAAEGCPVAIVARASWPEERVVRGTLGTIVGAVAAEPIDRTAVIFVGPGLAAEGFRESALYDAGYQRRFRGRAG